MSRIALRETESPGSVPERGRVVAEGRSGSENAKGITLSWIKKKIEREKGAP